MINGQSNGAAYEPPPLLLAELLMADNTTARLFEKLDELSSSITATKLEARETKVRVENIEHQLNDIRSDASKRDSWTRAESLVKYAIGALTGGGAVIGILKLHGG